MQVRKDPEFGHLVVLPETDGEERLLSMAAVTRVSLNVVIDRPASSPVVLAPRTGSVLLSEADDRG